MMSLVVPLPQRDHPSSPWGLGRANEVVKSRAKKARSETCVWFDRRSSRACCGEWLAHQPPRRTQANPRAEVCARQARSISCQLGLAPCPSGPLELSHWKVDYVGRGSWRVSGPSTSTTPEKPILRTDPHGFQLREGNLPFAGPCATVISCRAALMGRVCRDPWSDYSTG